MFGQLKSILRKVGQSKEEEMLARVFEDDNLQAQIVDLNTKRQLYEQGVTSQGGEVGEYAPITISFYKPLAASQGRDGKTDHVTLTDTGDFYRSFRVMIDDEGFWIEADSIKEGVDLEIEYPDILGLTDESINEIIPQIREQLREQVRHRLAA